MGVFSGSGQGVEWTDTKAESGLVYLELSGAEVGCSSGSREPWLAFGAEGSSTMFILLWMFKSNDILPAWKVEICSISTWVKVEIKSAIDF